MDTTLELVEELRRRVREERIKTVEEARTCMCRCIADAMTVGDPALDLSTKPSVVLFIGVNGVGKTTTIGKIGPSAEKGAEKGAAVRRRHLPGRRRRAADHLGRPLRVEIIKAARGGGPAAVVFDAASAAKARKTDVVLVDTAGRLHNKQNLMNELNKISRVIDRELPGCARETLLVLDATTGQNGLIQAKQFKEAAGITGIVLTKLDGTAKGASPSPSPRSWACRRRRVCPGTDLSSRLTGEVQGVEYWSGKTLDLALAFCLFRVILNIHRYGLREPMALFAPVGKREGDPKAAPGESGMGLIVLLLLGLISVLFC